MPKQETVFVTGGASGIGFAIVEAVLEKCWRVIIVDRAEESLEQSRKALAQHGERARFLRLD
ncbi:MAG TPA: SDR family NAD(P)-dependent oxidoreductase, partial [Microvirga sp.]|nr:SDR family NAD(P)-dependent oxidoreductase [Microvirga sp.]